MSGQPEPDALEHRVARVMQALPALRAPATLQRRVLAELARRSARPWWQRSFRHWPAAVRAGFVGVCGVLVLLTAAGGSSALPSLPSLGGLRLQAIWRAGADLTDSLRGALPSWWLYAALTLAMALYGVLFALGAAAYQTVVQTHTGDR